MRQRFHAAVAIFAIASASTGGLLADEHSTDAGYGLELGWTGDVRVATFDDLPFANPVPEVGAIVERQPNADARPGIFDGVLLLEPRFGVSRADPLLVPPNVCSYIFSAKATLECQWDVDPQASALPQFRWLSPSEAEFTQEDGRTVELSLGNAN